jgi:mono/diheme cytochrome c family protein
MLPKSVPQEFVPAKSSQKSMFPESSSGRGHCSCWAFRFAFVWVCAAVALVSLTGTSFCQSTKSAGHAKTSGGGAVARGKYFVEGVAMCGQCHTPNDAGGVPDRAHWLQGAPVPFQPSKPDSNWPINAPRIGGTPLPASDADMIKLLTTGIWTTGTQLRAPMPQFRMNRSDAEAVVAYLKSVRAQQ